MIAQLRLFARRGFSHPLVIADSSDRRDAELARAAKLAGTYRYFGPQAGYYQKLSEVLAGISTPLVLIVPDKKITFPHAIEPLVEHLSGNPACVAAVGYVLRFQRHQQDFDIFRVFFFTPSIEEPDPLRRMYHLMRRYQPSGFAVFRTEALAASITQASRIEGKMFQELMFMNALALQGAIARLPVIFSLHGAEDSLSPLDQRHPLYWFLRDPRSFFHRYAAYRSALADLVRRTGARGAPGTDIEQVLDLIHATWLGRECDTGIFNHAARLALGESLPPVEPPHDWPGPRPAGDGDLVHMAPGGGHRYLWRREVVDAEPRAEIMITGSEIAAVEDALEIFYES